MEKPTIPWVWPGKQKTLLLPKTEGHDAEEQGDFRARILAVEAEAEAALTRVGKCVFLHFQLATYFWDI